MLRIRLVRWQPGLNTVALIKWVRDASGLPLSDAKDLVDRFLHGEDVVITIQEENDASKYRLLIEEFGIDCEILD